MRTVLNIKWVYRIALLFVFAVAGTCYGQSSGHGAPTGPCNSSNLNSAYVATSTNVQYLCTRSGWTPNIGIGAPIAACTYVNYGNDYTDISGNATYSCGTGGWFQGSGGDSIELQTNGVANGSQTLLNLKQGTGITLADDGSGGITITGSTGTLPAAGATVDYDNSMLQPDSVVASTAYGLRIFGDSISMYGAIYGATTAANSYAGRLASAYNLTVGTNGTAYTYPVMYDYAIGGDTAADLTYRMFIASTPSFNPVDVGNPIATMAIGTNNIGAGSAEVVAYKQYHLAAAYWAALSSTNKVLAGSTSVTQSGTWAADTTYPAANGLTSSTAGSTLTYAANVGTSGAFVIWTTSTRSATSSYTVTVDGVASVDTITNSSTVTNTGTGYNNASMGVSVARFVTTPGTHTIVVTYGAGTLTVLGFGFPPTHRFRGTSAPRIAIAGVPPQQNNGNAANIAIYNAANLADSQLLVSDGLNAPFVDIFNAMDTYLDFNSVATQNCPASTNPTIHPNDCGHLHEADAFQSVIGAPFPTANSNLVQALNFSGIALPTSMTAANGQFTTQLSPTGTQFPPSTYCVNQLSGACFGITMLGNTAPYTTHLMGYSSNSRVAISMPPANATPTQVTSSEVAWWNSAGDAVLSNGTNTNTTARTVVSATGQFTQGMSTAPSSITGYHTFSGSAASFTALNGGINMGTGTYLGIHQFYSTVLARYVIAAYFDSNRAWCWTPYTSGTTPTSMSGFTDCPAYVLPNGSITASQFITSGSVSTPQVIGTGTVPTIAYGAAAGTGQAVGPTVTGSNMAGRISLTTGTDPVANDTLVTITFGGTVSTAPQTCMIQPVGASAQGQLLNITPTYPTTSGWTMAALAAITANTTYTFGYHCF